MLRGSALHCDTTLLIAEAFWYSGHSTFPLSEDQRVSRTAAVQACLSAAFDLLLQVQGLDLRPANKILGVVGASECDQHEQPASGAETTGHAQATPAATDCSMGAAHSSEHEDGSSPGSTAVQAAGSTSDTVPEPLPPLPYAVWQCGGGYVEQSDRVDLLQLDLAGPVQRVEGRQQVHVLPGATVHAVVLWLDYDLTPRSCHDGSSSNSGGSSVDGPSHDGSSGSRGGASTAGQEGEAAHGAGVWLDCGPERNGGPCSTVQAVMLLPEPLHAPSHVQHASPEKCGVEDAHGGGQHDGCASGVGLWLEIDAAFDPDDGEVEVGVAWKAAKSE